MRLVDAQGHAYWLAYCMNVHAGGTLASTLDALATTVRPLKERLGVDGPFGVGLRFDAATVHALARDPDARARLRAALDEGDLVPFTANAFVLGGFHGGRIKEQVYAPTWADEARLRYTLDFAEVMADLVPRDLDVSISTAPGGWRPWGHGSELDQAFARRIAALADGLDALESRTGRKVRVGLEPEPLCTIQRVEDAVNFFHLPLRQALDDQRAARYLGICYDVCHQAVMDEDAGTGLMALEGAGVGIVKLQASCALEVPLPCDEEARAALAAFDEDTYLHQVGARGPDGALRQAADLPEVLAPDSTWHESHPWRVHFHVPVFRKEVAGGLTTTQPALERALSTVARHALTPHIEIETYTWDVLPEAERAAGSGFDLVEALVHEYAHVLGLLGEGDVRPVHAPQVPDA